MMKATKDKVKLLKEEFQKFTKSTMINDENGFIMMGKALNIDIYSDVSIYLNCIDLHDLLLL